MVLIYQQIEVHFGTTKVHDLLLFIIHFTQEKIAYHMDVLCSRMPLRMAEALPGLVKALTWGSHSRSLLYRECLFPGKTSRPEKRNSEVLPDI